MSGELGQLVQRLQKAHWIVGDAKRPTGAAMLVYRMGANAAYSIIRPDIKDFMFAQPDTSGTRFLTQLDDVFADDAFVIEVDWNHPPTNNPAAIHNMAAMNAPCNMDYIDVTKVCAPVKMHLVGKQFVRDLSEAYCWLYAERVLPAKASSP